MIGSGTISSYGTHTHEHTVTKCLHETYDMKSGRGGGMPGGAGMAAGKTAEWRQENFSFTNFLSGGWKGFVSKSFELLGKIWNDGGQDADHEAGRSAVWQAAVFGTEGAAAEKTGQTAGVPVPAETGTAAAVREQPQEQLQKRGKMTGTGREAVPKAENISGNMADNAEDAADGRRWKEQAKVRKYVRQFGKTAAGIRRFWDAREETEKEEEEAAEGNAMDYALGDSSYLLDSYNRSGEYSTLAKDRSLEGQFRAMG